MYLNGTEIKNYDTQFAHFNDYALLCSSDGNLPLELFKYQTDNVLAIYQKGHGGWHEFTNMGVSYRLTVYQSAGAPIVVWSTPDNTKFMHYEPGGQPPVGWEKVGFDDKNWKEAVPARMITDYWGWAELPDPAFKGFLGNEGYVPFLSHNKVGNASADMINVFRSTFRLPYKPGKLVTYSYQKQARQGEKVMVRIIPARDVASIGPLSISAALPQGLNPLQAPGAAYNASTRKLTWNFPSPAKSLATHIQSVADNSGFIMPQKAFGPWKPNRPPHDYIRNMTMTEYYDSSSFPSGAQCWFQMSPPPFKDGPGAPIILSVTFQSQFLPRGFNGLVSYTVDHIMFNYSTDGTNNGAKGKDGVNISKFAGGDGSQNWANGYYDATYDRVAWKWSDLEKLRVMFRGKQVGDKKPDNLLLSCIASVRYYDPKDVAPYFYATVADGACRTVSITGQMISSATDSSAISASDPVILNPQACAPTATPTFTPVPTRVPTPRPGVTPPTPVPTPTPGLAFVGAKPGIKEVSSAPEPFRRSGCFVYFSLGGSVTNLYFIVYDASGAQIAKIDAGAFSPGKNQLFYDGLTDKKKPLAPGRYTYELRGQVGTYIESFRSAFNKEGDRYK
jgi:hypothetical protein